MEPTAAVVEVLGGRTVVGLATNAFELADRMREGLPYAAMESTMTALGISRERLADIVHLPARTAARRKLQQKLTPDESDRLFRVARVLAHARGTFGQPDKASRWLQRANQALAGQVPLDLLGTDIGVQLVEDILGRIDHGIYT